jgi:tRNA (guanine37-N1)-methyltransferase
MTNFIKCLKKDANIVRQELIAKEYYAKGIKAQNDSKCVYFPVTSKDIKIKNMKNYSIVAKKSEEYVTTRSFRDILVQDFKIKDYMASFDTVGNIAIIKVTDEMQPKEKQIAKALLESNHAIKTVVKKDSEHHGKYRVEDVKYLAGKKTLTTFVKESDCIFKIELGKMFFSTRLSYERERLAELVKDGSTVGVFFSGVAPFSIVIGKHKPNCKIYSIELNRSAHRYAKENIELNKITNVKAICADVNKYADKITNECDYVIMPLPKTSDLFLESAYKAIKKGKTPGLITLYKFVPKASPYGELEKDLKLFAKKKNKKLKIVFKREVRDYSAKIVQVVIDFKFV